MTLRLKLQFRLELISWKCLSLENIRQIYPLALGQAIATGVFIYKL